MICTRSPLIPRPSIPTGFTPLPFSPSPPLPVSQSQGSSILSSAAMYDLGPPPANGPIRSPDLKSPLSRAPPAYTPHRKLKIVTVGAGFSALIFAHKLQHERLEFQELVEHKIYELRDDIGGTWLVNTYPGVQCDVPAHVYVWLALHMSPLDSSDNTGCIDIRDSVFLLIQSRTGVIFTPKARIFKPISRKRPRSGTWTETCSSATR